MSKIYMLALYKVKPESLDEVRQAADRFVSEVKDKEPSTLFYEVYQGIGDNSFFHVMTFEDVDAEERHRTTPHMSNYAGILQEACEEDPVFVELNLLASNVRGADKG